MKQGTLPRDIPVPKNLAELESEFYWTEREGKDVIAEYRPGIVSFTDAFKKEFGRYPIGEDYTSIQVYLCGDAKPTTIFGHSRLCEVLPYERGEYIHEVRTIPTTPEKARETLESFLAGFKNGGIDLHGEDARTLWGRRITLVFGYDDMS